jgi:hypothetical protein
MPQDNSLPGFNRRKMLQTLGAVPLAATLVGCSAGGATDSDDSTGASSPSASPSPAPTPAPGPSAAEPPPPTPAGFVHPGLLHTQADFDRMATKVKDSVSPWIGGWQALLGTRLNDLTAWPDARAEIYRGNDHVHAENYTALFKDVGRAYVAAMHWKVTGDTRYADQAVRFMNAWSPPRPPRADRIPRLTRWHHERVTPTDALCSVSGARLGSDATRSIRRNPRPGRQLISASSTHASVRDTEIRLRDRCWVATEVAAQPGRLISSPCRDAQARLGIP